MSKLNFNRDYDSEPVYYCRNCLSLKIKYEESVDTDCCGACGGTDIAESTFEEWERLYKRKYGKEFTAKSGDMKKSPIFKLSIDRLMIKVSESSEWKHIIKGIYHHFPDGLSRADSMVMFFDKLIKDNKLDSLRTLLYKMKL